MDYEKLKNFLNENDTYCRYSGIKLTHISAGYAEAVMEITPNVLNGRKVVQGGAITTLADFAFAGAANSLGCSAVSLNINVSFIAPGTGKFLKAAAEKVHHGRATCVYSVRVVNDEGKLIATANINGFIIDAKPVV